MADDPKPFDRLDRSHAERLAALYGGSHALDNLRLQREMDEIARTKGRPVHIGGHVYRQKPGGELVYDEEASAPAIREQQEREAKAAAEAEARAVEAKRNEPSEAEKRFSAFVDRFHDGGLAGIASDVGNKHAFAGIDPQPSGDRTGR